MDLPPEEGVGMYGFRHYFASNALGNGIPITDVAEWMGHNSIEETYRTYRHLMPGSIAKAARTLDTGLGKQPDSRIRGNNRFLACWWPRLVWPLTSRFGHYVAKL
ncbi:tyrosine-type recombinase/integrase [Streptomyces anulatus]|uniref:tyrosine-type recombinase/integrase n=1 Tax=Streptomyces anulatus TaxID=1892 RepID=UPI0035575F03